jgi:hypothetical protein
MSMTKRDIFVDNYRNSAITQFNIIQGIVALKHVDMHAIQRNFCFINATIYPISLSTYNFCLISLRILKFIPYCPHVQHQKHIVFGLLPLP